MERTTRPFRFRGGLVLALAVAASAAIPASTAAAGGRVTFKSCYDAGTAALETSIRWRLPYFVSDFDVELFNANGKLLAIDAQSNTPSLEGSITLHPAITAETLASVATIVVDLSGKGGATQLVRQAPHNGFKAC